MLKSDVAMDRKDHQRIHTEPIAYAFLSPTVFLIVFFLISPMLSGLIMSLYKTSLSGITNFVGLRNYQLLLSEDRFLNNLRLSVLYVGCCHTGNTVFLSPYPNVTRA